VVTISLSQCFHDLFLISAVELPFRTMSIHNVAAFAAGMCRETMTLRGPNIACYATLPQVQATALIKIDPQ
jgi:hypothetical protein